MPEIRAVGPPVNGRGAPLARIERPKTLPTVPCACRARGFYYPLAASCATGFVCDARATTPLD
jgi:hypothetical protein